MSFENIIKNVNGYLIIEIEGYFVERFINLMMNNNLKIWDIEQENVGVILAKINAKDFDKAKSMADMSKCKIKIVDKIGVPFVAQKYKHRKIFAILIAVVSTLITILNLFIWKVDINGDFSIPIERLKDELAKEKVVVGHLKKDINIDNAKLNVMIKEPDIVWMNIKIKGNKVIVEIMEKDDEKIESAKTEPGNIIADKNGIVSKIYVANGTAKVQKGDTIEKGQILISGEIGSEVSNIRYVPAEGEIIIKTWYADRYKVPYVNEIVTKTGNKKVKHAIKIFDCKINLLNNGTKFEKYDTIIKSNSFKLFGMFEWPIEVTTKTYEEIKIDTVTYTFEQAKNIAIDLAKKGVVKKIPQDAKIIDEKVTIQRNSDDIEAEVIIECEEKVGKYIQIGG